LFLSGSGLLAEEGEQLEGTYDHPDSQEEQVKEAQPNNRSGADDGLSRRCQVMPVDGPSRVTAQAAIASATSSRPSIMPPTLRILTKHTIASVTSPMPTQRRRIQSTGDLPRKLNATLMAMSMRDLACRSPWD
jgi:hypothetical protein